MAGGRQGRLLPVLQLEMPRLPAALPPAAARKPRLRPGGQTLDSRLLHAPLPLLVAGSGNDRKL